MTRQTNMQDLLQYSIFRAAEGLVELLSIEDLEKRATFPDDYPIREV